MAGTLNRIQHLFRRGDVVVLEAENPETGEVEKIPVYVAKLNAFEKDEAIKDGRSARARRIISFDRDEDEQLQITALLSSMTDADITEDLMRRKAGELLSKAEEQVRADPSWRERLEAIDRAAIAEDGATAEPERNLLATLIDEYQQAIEKGHQVLLRQLKRDLDGTPREEREQDYRRLWRDMLGATAFYENRRQTEVWYALRECEVALDPDGEPDLKTLKVGDRICPTRANVNDLPDEIVTKVLRALDGEMTPKDAGNSDAPSASSGSSERQSVEADSVPSTPTEMSPRPAGTSSRPSARP